MKTANNRNSQVEVDKDEDLEEEKVEGPFPFDLFFFFITTVIRKIMSCDKKKRINNKITGDCVYDCFEFSPKKVQFHLLRAS